MRGQSDSSEHNGKRSCKQLQSHHKRSEHAKRQGLRRTHEDTERIRADRHTVRWNSRGVSRPGCLTWSERKTIAAPLLETGVPCHHHDKTFSPQRERESVCVCECVRE